MAEGGGATVGAAGEAPKVLIVDDTPANLRVLIEMLEPAGYAVMAARSGEQALAIAEKARPRVILLDVRMPDMDGHEVCRRLKAGAATAAIPVLFVSADPRPEAVAAARAAGGAGYLAKPFRQEEVLARVRELAG